MENTPLTPEVVTETTETTVEMETVMENQGQKRWRSKAAWAAFFGLAGLVLGNVIGWDKLGITEEIWHGLIDALLATLVAFGVLNNPTDKESF